MHLRNPSCSPSKGRSTSQGAMHQASWTEEDINTLLDLVIAHHLSAGEGMNFKFPFWNFVSTALVNPIKGGPKNARVCKEKWKRVHNHLPK